MTLTRAGDLDLGDIVLLSEQIQSEDPNLGFDLDDDAQVTLSDLNVWVKDLRETWLGDANLDGEFNTSDLVGIFQAGKFDGPKLSADWSQGDWNGDGRFNSTDLVIAFQDGGFERGPIAAAIPIPEPSTAIQFAVGISIVYRFRRRQIAG